jgi:hypothetical protein
MRSVSYTVLLVALLAPVASAQYRGQRGGDGPEDALALPPRPAPGVASLVLQHAVDLALTDSQRVVLESIRRTQDSANTPWIQRLESLRPRGVPANGPNDLSQEQRDEIAARRAAIAVALDGMRENNALARQRTMAVLSPGQQEKAAELENDAQKRANEERARRGRDAAGGGRRRGGGGMDRRPED